MAPRRRAQTLQRMWTHAPGGKRGRPCPSTHACTFINIRQMLACFDPLFASKPADAHAESEKATPRSLARRRATWLFFEKSPVASPPLQASSLRIGNGPRNRRHRRLDT
eukprot:CAMPEP_0119357352 /NCGR_PEP_ID=MMETSP1334-20130426/5767_1 /TAXON_ID=127549 /ORGANISM="Calcidiscus leptoporus, Strain RCC1130" /LENGTH=108 /DNA_ID=CAMNT_0007371573 /DNA_START=302 /DNA_END=628 /DNA_ORIENTATION=+